MRLILIGVGLSTLLLPMLYAVVAIAIGTKIKSNLASIVFASTAFVLAVVAFVRPEFASTDQMVSETGAGYENFVDHCSSYGTGNVHRRISGVDSVRRSTSQTQGANSADALGSIVLPSGIDARLALSGVERYAQFEGGGFLSYVDERGMLERTRQMSGTQFRVGIEWEPSDLSEDSAVGGVLLRIKDLDSGNTLATHPAFVWLGSSGDEMPYPTHVPGRVARSYISSCPQPSELIDFIKHVASPELRETSND